MLNVRGILYKIDTGFKFRKAIGGYYVIHQMDRRQ